MATKEEELVQVLESIISTRYITPLLHSGFEQCNYVVISRAHALDLLKHALPSSITTRADINCVWLELLHALTRSQKGTGIFVASLGYTEDGCAEYLDILLSTKELYHMQVYA